MSLNDLPLQVPAAKNMCAFFIFPMRATCSVHLIDYNMLIILGPRSLGRNTL